MKLEDFKKSINLILKENYNLINIEIYKETTEYNDEETLRVYPYLLFKNKDKEQYIEVNFQDMDISYGETKENLKIAETYAVFALSIL